uniref:Nucleolar and coiled-body phosphoprotein 1 n=1 Tax=Schizaphis graminum TaxID=13262 RepID=A0A2S2NB17_SCHGA
MGNTEQYDNSGNRSFDSDKKKKQQNRRSDPYRRVRDDNVSVDGRLLDNSLKAKKGQYENWGKKAALDLQYTKGKSFRHEKTKKKRGSYRGGQIDLGVNSIKFDD